ncbi:Hsp33 family molecular chaperone HslO [Candidatus Mycoplasma mahonii]|uniref:Hsp33 family molecular chaperone HslO n=1 Tax=Candidatus Mycoplasma mahonii TaxID=3004105 RepID=UPI0026ED35BA|nr:Hsp33 family molecular chaperone HslO [Candidatus Mycoplasma mahonii]WKX02196.1 Hsp33 family molecular chaperone HslO [Candidatus Mycoplasma mahonii]
MNNITHILKDNIRIYVSEMTELSQKIMDVHHTKPLASLSMSTAMATYGAFFALKKGLQTSIFINGNGSLKTIIFEYDGKHGVRALVGDPSVVTEYDDTKFNDIPLTLGIGDGGHLKIVHKGDKLNYGGNVEIANGDITTDLAYYLDQSEQIYSAVISSVLLKKKNMLQQAKAVVFQMLPGHSEKDVLWVENFIKENSLSKMNTKSYIKKIDGTIIESTTLQWKTTCSKEKMFHAAKTMSANDIKELISEKGFVEVKCRFCHKQFRFTNKDFNI